MGKRRNLFLLFGVLLLFSACKQQEGTNPEKKPGELTVTGPAKAPDDWQPAGLDRPVSENVVSLNSGRALGNLSVTGEDPPYYCNLEENLQNTETNRVPILVCRDPVYGITYYVDYGRDYYIYALRDGVSELAAAVPAKDLFCRDGELYFIADSYGRYTFDGLAQGNILKYNPADGSIGIVIGQTATEMMVYPDGICYGYREQVDYSSEDGGETVHMTEGEKFYYSFAEGVSTPLKGSGKRRWKTYHFQPVLEECQESDPTLQQLRELGYTGRLATATALELVDSSREEAPVLEKDVSVLNFFLVGWLSGDLLYYTDFKKEEGQEDRKKVLMTYHMETGEQEEVVELDAPVGLSAGFILFRNTLYFGKDLRLSLEDGDRCQPVFADKSFGRIDAFYTDGEVLFCLREGKLWRLEEKQGEAIRIPDLDMPVGSYVYHLYLPGTAK